MDDAPEFLSVLHRLRLDVDFCRCGLDLQTAFSLPKNLYVVIPIGLRLNPVRIDGRTDTRHGHPESSRGVGYQLSDVDGTIERLGEEEDECNPDEAVRMHAC